MGGYFDMSWGRTVVLLMVSLVAFAAWASAGQSSEAQEPDEPEKKLILRIIGPDGRPVTGAKVGTGINVFEDSQGHPPQTITMWLRGQKRWWPLRSDAKGDVVLTGEDAEFRHFYALHAARGWVGYRRLLEGSASGRVIVRMEPACRVQGELTSVGFDDLGHPLSKTVAFLYDSRDRLMMYYVSERGHYEFLLPPGTYELECVGEGVGGVETERRRLNLDIESGQRAFDVGSIDLVATRLAELFDKPAPDLEEITRWRGDEPPRLGLLRGQVVVLVFWGSWSRPCLKTMPPLIELHDLYAEQGVTIISVHDNSVTGVGELETKLTEARQLYWGRRDLPFPVGIDRGEGRGAVHEAYGINQWPTVIVIDRAGKVAGKVSPWGELQRRLPLLLEETDAEVAIPGDS